MQQRPGPWRQTVRRAQQMRVIVNNPVWCGGVNRDHLAYLMRLDPADKRFGVALAVAAKQGMITFCQGYICAVPARGESLPAAGARVVPALPGGGPVMEGAHTRLAAGNSPPALFVEPSTLV